MVTGMTLKLQALISSASLFSGKEETLTLGTLSIPEYGRGLSVCLTCPVLDQLPLWVGTAYSEQSYAQPSVLGGRSCDGEGSYLLKSGEITKRRAKGMLDGKSQNTSHSVSLVPALLVAVCLNRSSVAFLTFPNCTLPGAAQTVLSL